MKRTRYCLLWLLLLAVSFQSLAQDANSWIRYDQSYLKIETDRDDIYRVLYEDLIAAGFPVESLSPTNFRMYHRGEEVAIFVEDGGDGSFGTGDYIEFYGRRNDGVSDVELFDRPRDQIHQYFNLFSDKTAFFLTVDQTTPGRRIAVSSESSTGLTPIVSHRNEVLEVYSDEFSFGQYFPIGNPTGETKLSKYSSGQMFLSNIITLNASTAANGTNFRDFRIDGLLLQNESEGKPNLEVQVVGFNNRLHNVSIHVGPSTDNLRTIKEDLHFNYNNFINPSSQIEWSDVSDEGRLFVRVEAVGFPEIPVDRVGVGFIKVDFPQITDMAGASEKLLFIPPSASNQLVELQNVTEAMSVYDVTDYRNPTRVSFTTNESTLSFVAPASAEGRKLLVRSTNGIETKTPNLVDFKYNLDYVTREAYDYLMISHSFLRSCEGCEYEDPVQAYIDYRESLEGGEFKVLYADVDELFDEFNYGEYSPLAIRRYVEFLYRRTAFGSRSDTYLFLVGKSRRVDNRIQRLPEPLAINLKELVPTMGAPGSDILYTEGLEGTPHYPAFPVGRLSVWRPENVGYYLNKVKEKEASIKDSPWTKNFLHLSGGLNTRELVRFRELIDGFAGRVRGEFLGANVTNFSKQTNNAVQKFNISQEINRGVGLVTFFGHSSNSFTDIDIGAVTDDANGYENKGRYPAFLVNGCRGGEIFFSTSFGENWLAAEDRGAVSYMAHSDVGISNILGAYSNAFYDLLADTLWMTKSIGQIQQRAIADFLNTPFVDESRIATAEQTVLQGDPAIPLFGHDKVDYIVRPEDIFLNSIDGREITAATQFFELGVVVNNGGRTTQSPLSLRINRRLEDGTVINLPAVQVPPVIFRDTLYYEVSNQGFDVLGENTFEVLLDFDNAVEEGSETNNSAERVFDFPATGTFNTSPGNFALVNETSQTLVVQSANLKLNDKTFVIELDTTKSFDSPWKQTATLTGKGLASWDVELLPETFRDTVHYFWRTVFSDEQLLEDVPWSNSYFTFTRNGDEGWGQTIFDQFEELNLSSLSKSETGDSWIFAGTTTDINVQTFGISFPVQGNDPNAVVVDINGDPQIPFRPCELSTLNAIAFNKDSGRPYFVLATPGEFDFRDPLKCGKSASVINTFPESHLSDISVLPEESLLRQYVDGVDDGDMVLLFSVGGLSYEWPQQVRDELARLGIQGAVISNLAPGDPFIAYGRKGAIVGTATVVTGDPPGNEPNANGTSIDFTTQILASADSGTVETPAIGPAAQWGTLRKKIVAEGVEDEVTFEVRGIGLDGSSTVLFPNVTADQLDLSSIDVRDYPFVRLFVNMEDRVSATPAQLQDWSVTFNGVPEGVLSLQNEGNEGIELIEGQPFLAQFKFTNISPFDFLQPLQVRYTLTNQVSGEVVVETTEIPAALAREEVSFELPIETEGRVGLNDLEVFVNPGAVVIEQFVGNNIIRLESFLDVRRDETNPNIDVTFDGQYILDGDIVSPTPVINVELRDNNPYLLKTDGTGVDIKLGRVCDDCELEPIDVASPLIEIVPATEESNFRVEFRPDFMQESMGDGLYRLEVEVPDASGNQSGVGPYSVTFEVVTISSITHFYPYPNPFSTSTRFVFTLTGSEIPDQVKIQIFTVTGKLVREITQAEIGPIRIGQNITQYAWDGRDEFGDQLANGTYLYRVKIGSSNGTNIVRRGTSKDKAFDNNFGKLVILR